jgi:TRAP-type C4-dicarboxylate transport system permease small subunit
MFVQLKKITHAFAWLGAATALGVGLMTVVSVLGRTLFKAPIPGDVELTQMGMAFAISLCLPWCQLRGANIFVDFFTQGAKPGTQRWLDAVGSVSLALMYALLAWRTSAGALAVREAGETSMIMALPMWWAYACLAPGLALAGVIALCQALNPQALQHPDTLNHPRQEAV